MLGGCLASVCQSQSIFASASPGAPTLINEEAAPAPRKGWRCWDSQLGWQWWQPPLSPWVWSCGGLFAATSETHSLISLSQGGLGVPCAGGERLITPVATSKRLRRGVTAILRLLCPVAPGLHHSAWAAGGLNPAWPLSSLCCCRSRPHGHACIALGFYNGKSLSDVGIFISLTQSVRCSPNLAQYFLRGVNVNFPLILDFSPNFLNYTLCCDVA